MLRNSHGEEIRPRTIVTRRMMQIILERLLASGDHSREVELRSQLMLAIEALLGMRVGEVCGGGDGHGLLANNLVILREITTGEQSI
mmetsp:Transcript_45392/g.96589  ORF Transcript_45392/g.96589 Transcript_45392/m.96589 type:complete len:87 (-) Transcript_45392:1261-1521(-)